MTSLSKPLSVLDLAAVSADNAAVRRLHELLAKRWVCDRL